MNTSSDHFDYLADDAQDWAGEDDQHGTQTHDDIAEIPEGVELPDSSGSLTEDVEEPEAEDYSDVEDVPAEVDQAAEADETDETDGEDL